MIIEILKDICWIGLRGIDNINCGWQSDRNFCLKWRADLGQLQMYINYFDRYEKLPDENPTVGMLLYIDKNDTTN